MTVTHYDAGRHASASAVRTSSASSKSRTRASPLRPTPECSFQRSPSSPFPPIVAGRSNGDATRSMDTSNLRTTAPQRAVLAGLGIAIGLLTACASPAAQPADPPPPTVTVAEVLSREITEWDELTGRLEAVNTVEIRPRVSGFISEAGFQEGALVRRGQLLFQIDPRPFQTQVDRLSAELIRARATVRRTSSELTRAERLAGENAMSLEERERRASAAEESKAQVAAVEAALRAAELDLEFTRVTSPIDGRVGPRHRHRRQPGVERPRRGDAVDDRRLARSDLRLVRRRRADLPSLRRSRSRRQARQRAAVRRPHPHGAVQRSGLSARGRDELPRQPGRSVDRHHSRPRDVPQHRPQSHAGPVRPAAAGRQRQLPRPADSGSRGRHRPRQAVRVRRGRDQDRALSRRDARADR